MARFDVGMSLSQSHRGDRAARQKLLSQYRNYLFLLVRLRIGRDLQVRVDASDVVQEVLLRAVRDLPAFRGTTEAELMQWLRRILSHTMTDFVRQHRAEKRDVALERQLEDELEQSSRMLANVMADHASSPSQKASRRESARLLADAIASFPTTFAKSSFCVISKTCRWPKSPSGWDKAAIACRSCGRERSSS